MPRFKDNTIQYQTAAAADVAEARDLIKQRFPDNTSIEKLTGHLRSGYHIYVQMHWVRQMGNVAPAAVESMTLTQSRASQKSTFDPDPHEAQS